MLKKVSKKMWDSLHLFRSRSVIFPVEEGGGGMVSTGELNQTIHTSSE